MPIDTERDLDSFSIYASIGIHCCFHSPLIYCPFFASRFFGISVSFRCWRSRDHLLCVSFRLCEASSRSRGLFADLFDRQRSVLLRDWGCPRQRPAAVMSTRLFPAYRRKSPNYEASQPAANRFLWKLRRLNVLCYAKNLSWNARDFSA